MTDTKELRLISGNLKVDGLDYYSEQISFAADELDALREQLRLTNIDCSNQMTRVAELESQLAEARSRETEQDDLLWLATINEWSFVADWDGERTGRISIDVGHDCFTPPAGDYSQAVKNAIQHVLDDGRDGIEDYKGILAAIEAASKEAKP